ncbi:hypothetical protein ADEAN_000076800 [Angomonas deanei]|uniref:Uncharacterized protein n=1 Tax=Angomonas deanei TaxID=59799 RepID=A0A7G2C3N3_9TRYP|nr:hypothetical protein ADEAN_000076800 [Angomonas deanei]
MEPNDEFAHIVLFDWLLLPRDDPSLVKSLRAALVRSDSRFLGAFMSRKSLQYPDVYALYLRGTSRGSAQAVEQFVTLASTDANSIQADDCLQYRIDNMKQALSCATECNHSDKEEISRRLASLTAQKMLCDVIGVFLSSRCPTMDEVCEVNGVRGTQREVASHQLHSLQRYILTAQDLYETARIYSHFGGGEVQMELLLSVGASQNEILQAMQNCYQTTLKTTEEVSRLLLLRYYPALPEFPLPYVALWLEKEEFVRSPTGSTRTVDLMRTCRLEPLSIIWAYTALIDGNEPLLARQVAASGVSPAYLTCSLAYAASILYDYKAIGQVRQSHVTENVLRKVTEGIRNAALDTHSRNDVEALKKAEEIIRETENRRLLHRF